MKFEYVSERGDVAAELELAREAAEGCATGGDEAFFELNRLSTAQCSLVLFDVQQLDKVQLVVFCFIANNPVMMGRHDNVPQHCPFSRSPLQNLPGYNPETAKFCTHITSQAQLMDREEGEKREREKKSGINKGSF